MISKSLAKARDKGINNLMNYTLSTARDKSNYENSMQYVDKKDIPNKGEKTWKHPSK